MTDKNFIRNLCMAAGLFIAFLLLAPIKFGPVTPDSAPVTSAVENATATLDTTESVPTPEAPATETAPVYLDIPLTIGDSQYRFSVNRNKENVRELAIQVCNDNAAALGLTTADELEAQCVEPVVKSLKEQVDLTLEQVVAVELNIEGRNVQFEIDTAVATSIDDQAGVFCSNYGAEFGVTQETLADCTQNIKRALQERLTTPSQQQEEQLPAAQVFQTDLDIQGRVVRFNVEATYESIGEQARTFCTTHGTEFGVTEETLGECQQNIQRALEEKIVAFLQAQQEQQPPAATNPTFQTDLDIQGRVVRFNVEATYESIGEQATTFCTTHGAEFGVTEETLGECQQNIQRALEEKIVAFLSTE